MWFSSQFIVFEGLDGSGKTTQMRLLAENIRREFPLLEVLETREPGGAGVFGETIRNIVTTNPDINDKTRTMLFLADRAEHWAKVIDPALNRGCIVLCDRFVDSTLAYSQAVSEATIRAFQYELTCGHRPDWTFFLDISPEEAAGRQTDPNLFEARGLDFMRRVHRQYREVSFLRTTRERVVIDATRPVTDVADRVFRELVPELEELSRSRELFAVVRDDQTTPHCAVGHTHPYDPFEDDEGPHPGGLFRAPLFTLCGEPIPNPGTMAGLEAADHVICTVCRDQMEELEGYMRDLERRRQGVPA